MPRNRNGGMRATSSFTTVNVAPQIKDTPTRAASHRYRRTVWRARTSPYATRGSAGCAVAHHDVDGGAFRRFRSGNRALIDNALVVTGQPLEVPLEPRVGERILGLCPGHAKQVRHLH